MVSNLRLPNFVPFTANKKITWRSEIFKRLESKNLDFIADDC